MPNRKPLVAADGLALLHRGAAALIAAAGIGLAAATVLGGLGLAPVLDLPLTIGESVHAGAGFAVQAGVALLLLCLGAILPAGLRVLRLERSHRDFQIAISDVSEAYSACHAADRSGAFTLGREFDAVKERYRYLHQHPDLGSLEPELLEVAAEMSQVSRDLARTYSDETVSRARSFLAGRQEEIAAFETRLDRAQHACADLRRLKAAVDDGEHAAEARLARLESEFGGLLAELGFVRAAPGIVTLTPASVVAAE